MKLLNVDVPPNMIGWWEAYIAANKNPPGATTTARTRRGSNRIKSRQYKKRGVSKFDPIIKALMTSLGYKAKTSFWSMFLQDQRDKIRRGEFDPQFWLECDTLFNAFLQNTPTWEEQLAPPVYAYRDTLNRPSLPTYGAGEVTTAPTIYTGGTTAEIYRDMLLRWERKTFELAAPIIDEELTAPIIYLGIDQSIASDMRGVRTAQDCNIISWLHEPGSAPEFTTVPPVDRDFTATTLGNALVWPIVWRYKTPVSSPPYYQATATWHAVMRAIKVSDQVPGNALERLTVCASPRPAYGLWFNNNTALSVTVNFTISVYQAQQLVAGSYNGASAIDAGIPLRWFTHGTKLRKTKTKATAAQGMENGSGFIDRIAIAYTCGFALQILNSRTISYAAFDYISHARGTQIVNSSAQLGITPNVVAYTPRIDSETGCFQFFEAEWNSMIHGVPNLIPCTVRECELSRTGKKTIKATHQAQLLWPYIQLYNSTYYLQPA